MAAPGHREAGEPARGHEAGDGIAPPPGPACPLAPPRKHHVPEGSHCSRSAAGSHSTAGWSLPAPRRAVPVPVAVRHHRPVGDRHDQVCVRGQAWLFVTFPCLSRYPKQLRAPRSSAGGWESDAKEADVPAGALCPPCRRQAQSQTPRALCGRAPLFRSRPCGWALR